MTQNSIRIFEYLLDNDGIDITAADIAADLNIPIGKVNGTINFGGIRHRNAEGLIDPLVYREPFDIEYRLKNGKERIKKGYYIRLTDSGREYDYWTQEGNK